MLTRRTDAATGLRGGAYVVGLARAMVQHAVDQHGTGQLQAVNLDTKVTSPPVSTGSACTATEIQATQRWVYWSCGDNGPAGVYDLQTRAEIAVPAGPVLLGDGYLVRHDMAAGEFQLFDIHDDTVTGPADLASLPAGSVPDYRNITWAVDKYSGDVAYVTADDSARH